MSRNQPATSRRILVIDDSPDIHRDFDKILAPSKAADEIDDLERSLFGASTVTFDTGDGFELHHAFQGEQGLEEVASAKEAGSAYIGAFIDMRMPPGWDGLRTISEIRKIDPHLPLVVCTAYSDHSWQDIAGGAGALDKLLILKKPFDPIELLQLARSLKERFAVTKREEIRTEELESLVQVRTAELEAARRRDRVRMDELEQIVEQRTGELRKQALQDKLTGLPNRTLFYDRVSKVLADPDQPHFAIFFIDFDRFKLINDSLGHEYGDKLLISIGRRLSDALAAENTRTGTAASIARLGGDEFCVLLENADLSVAKSIAERLIDLLSLPHNLDGHEVVSTASIGITLNTLGCRSAEDLLRDADLAMYRAKHLGRARCVVFDQTMHEEALKRLRLENALRHAVDRDELDLYYQSIVSLDSAAIVGAEGLLRWQPPGHGIVSPGDFISIAEESDLIITLGRWVILRACRQLSLWQASTTRRPYQYLSINVSRRHLIHDSFLPTVREALMRYPVEPDTLVIEVTESTLMEQPALAEAALRGARALGVKVYIDDFGAGFSSLGNLQRFDFDGIKLDRSFLQVAGSPRRAAALIHSVATLSRDMNLTLICEGIETIEQLALLQAIGCENGQGYLFARPAPAERLAEIFANKRHVMVA